MLHKIIKTVTTICLILTMTCSTVLAASEGEIDITYVAIEGRDFVATTMDGVPALYNSSSSTYYYCSELIPRYYEAVYGIDIRIGDGNVTVLDDSNVYFVETDTPQKGDIMYGSPAARGKGYSHWGIVREIDADSVTIFEQNWYWNGQAGIDRVIEFPTTYYKFYTMVSDTGTLPQSLVTPTGVETASAWALTYVEQACEMTDLDVNFTETINRELFCQLAVGVAETHGLEIDGETAKEQAVNLGLLSSTDGDALTRQEAAIIATRLLDLIGTTPEVDDSILSLYTDAQSIELWATDAVATLTACGFLGSCDGKFQPTGSMTVEQAAVLMVQISNNTEPAITAVTYSNRAPLDTAPLASMEVVRLCSDSMFLSR